MPDWGVQMSWQTLQVLCHIDGMWAYCLHVMCCISEVQLDSAHVGMS